MSDLIKSDKTGLMQLMHDTAQALDLGQPFEREIYLFDSHVAGTTHVEGMEQLAPELEPGQRLDFLREPQNQYDSQAIKIQTKSGQKLGYVPKQDNLIFARLMDAGKLLFARIDTVEQRGSWSYIKIQIYLQEML